MGFWVRGQLTLMAAVFAMTSVAYFVIGLEGALFLGVFAGVAEAIPIVGPAIGAVPALIVAAASGQVELVFLVALVYVVIQVFEGNVLVPMVMRSAIGVPPFVIVTSLLDRNGAGRHRRRAPRGAVLGRTGGDPGACPGARRAGAAGQLGVDRPDARTSCARTRRSRPFPTANGSAAPAAQ